MSEFGSKTKSNQVYQILRDEIVSGTLLPREKLNISAIASRLGTSEIPIREALKRLQEQHFLSFVPYSGYSVKEISFTELKNLWTIRTSLEALANELLVTELNGEIPEEITQVLNQMEDCVKNNDTKRYSQLHKKFHISVYHLLKNDRLVELIDNMWEETERVQNVYHLKKPFITDSLQKHYQYLDAIRNRDVVLANAIFAESRDASLEFLKNVQENNLS